MQLVQFNRLISCVRSRARVSQQKHACQGCGGKQTGPKCERTGAPTVQFTKYFCCVNSLLRFTPIAVSQRKGQQYLGLKKYRNKKKLDCCCFQVPPHNRFFLPHNSCYSFLGLKIYCRGRNSLETKHLDFC